MEDVYRVYAEALRDGHRFAAAGKLKDALRCYETAAAAADGRAVPHVAAGGMLLRLGRAREALAAYDRALEREPGDLDALTGRVAALLATGRRAEAAQAQALVNSPASSAAGGPGDPATHLSSSDRMFAAGEDARAAGKTAAAVDAWLAEAAAHRAAGHHDAALEACLRALALDSSASRVHLEIAQLWLGLGWRDLALQRIRLLDRLLTLRPDEQVRAGLARLSAVAGESPSPR